MNTPPPVGESKAQSKILDPKANLKALFGIAALLVVLGVGFWIYLRFKIGSQRANAVAAIVTRQPIEIRNSVENVRANSTAWLPISTPYAGVLNVELSVVQGNGMDVYLVPTSELENVKAGRQFHFIQGFDAQQSRVYHRAMRIAGGSYYFVMRDKTLGILSSGSSDVKLHIRFEP